MGLLKKLARIAIDATKEPVGVRNSAETSTYVTEKRSVEEQAEYALTLNAKRRRELCEDKRIAVPEEQLRRGATGSGIAITTYTDEEHLYQYLAATQSGSATNGSSELYSAVETSIRKNFNPIDVRVESSSPTRVIETYSSYEDMVAERYALAKQNKKKAKRDNLFAGAAIGAAAVVAVSAASAANNKNRASPTSAAASFASPSNGAGYSRRNRDLEISQIMGVTPTHYTNGVPNYYQHPALREWRPLNF